MIVKNLGNVTAYADAVAAGYTGTREQFAQEIANAATYAGEAHESETAAAGSAEDAEAYAVGKRGGVDVEDTDPTYHNNAKYYATSAAGDASDAKDYRDAALQAKNAANADAGYASADALVAEGYSSGTQAGDPVESGSPYYHNNAKYYAEQAETSAGNASTSEINAGLSETAASGSASAAAADALKSEGYAIGKQNGADVASGSPYYHNSAKYYKEQAAASATASAAMTGLAPAFSASTAYAAGDYVIYSGTLYKFNVAHAAGAWTGSDASAVTLAPDVTQLKSDLKQVGNQYAYNGWLQGVSYRNTNTGKIVKDNNTLRCTTPLNNQFPNTTTVSATSGFLVGFVAYKGTSELPTDIVETSSWSSTINISEYTNDYYICVNVKKTDDSAITPEEILNNVLFHNNVYDQISKLETDIEAVDAKAEHNIYDYDLTGLFELGTVYLTSNGAVRYETTNNVVRVIRETSIALKQGDIISVKNTGYKVRIIHLSTPNTQEGYLEDDYTIPVDGDYIIAFASVSLEAVTVDEVLQSVAIVNSDTHISKKIISLEQSIEEINTHVSTLETELESVPVDNTPKGVFGIMTYNVGGWYNGSGTNVPADKYEQFLALQTSIFNRYKPDILCLQEYRDNISSGHSAASEILNPIYHFVETAKGTTTYDGKAICTSLSLEDAQNINYVSMDGNLARNYEKAYIYCNGKKVCVISTHFALLQANIEAEMTELIQAIANEDYVVVCMDSNVNSDPAGSAYATTLKQFTDAGYTLANQGQYITAPDGNWTIDNIAVSSNITIKSVVVDKQKENLEEGADHYPFIVYAEIF